MAFHSTTNRLTKSSYAVGPTSQIIEQLYKTFSNFTKYVSNFRRSFRSLIYGPTYAIYPTTYIYNYNIFHDEWDSLRENCPSHIYIKCYINASRLNRYIFRTVNAINILLSTLYTTPFLYGRVLFGILQLLLASIATFDTPLGSSPP